MTVRPIDGSDARGSARLEVRWILPGPPPSPALDWFEAYPVTTEAREDSYLVVPRLPGLAVKIRGHTAVDVKAYRGSPGTLEVPGAAEGRLGLWSKWSFLLGERIQYPVDSRSWQRVEKRRRMTAFLPDDDRVIAAPLAPDDRLICVVELSDVAVGDATWWTLALESAGPTDRLRDAIVATAGRFLGTGMPAQIRLRLEDSRPYSEWLEGVEARD